MNTNIEPKFRPKHLTIDDIKNGCITLVGDDNTETKLCMIQEEFRQGMESIVDFAPSVTFYGSARLGSDHASYKQAYSLAYRIAKELEYNVITGGGAGIMEAASKGAHDAGGKSIGLTIQLPHEQKTNEFVTMEIPFYFFFTRQVCLSYATEVCIFCAGGFGTFDELFEMLTLQQTNKIGKIPIILFGVEFWTPLVKVIKQLLVAEYKTVDATDLDLFIVTDSEEEVLEVIKKSRLRDGQDALS